MTRLQKEVLLEQHRYSRDWLERLGKSLIAGGGLAAEVFDGMTTAEAMSKIKTLREEEELRLAFFLCTSFEACLRDDYCWRASKRGKWRRFKELYRKPGKGAKAGITSILECWEEQFPKCAFALSGLLWFVDWRDWVAHGRSVKRHVPNVEPGKIIDAYRIVRDLIVEFPEW